MKRIAIATLAEARRENIWLCDRSAGSCHINPSPRSSHGGAIRTRTTASQAIDYISSTCACVYSFAYYEAGKNEIASTEHRRQNPRSWKSLTPEEADRRLRALDLYLNQPERALTCVRCKHALKPSGETVSKHLWRNTRLHQKHAMGSQHI